MARWLGILLAIGFAATSADAQVFKPKTKKTGTSEKAKKPSSEKSEKADKPEKTEKSEKSEKKSARSAPTKKRVTTKPKKGGKHSDDAASEDGPKESDKDFVKITDDDDIE